MAELAEDVRSGKLKAAELVQACLDRIEATKQYHAVLEINPQALERAHEIDRRAGQGRSDGRLLGVPFIAKDNFLTRHTHTTAASAMLKPFRAPYQATVIDKLEAEGAVMIAKANLDAFAHGSSTENSDFGPTKNPWDKTKVPGGSSGGSAAAVALAQCSFALGTDTGSSIRLPASFCGVVGVKPTYGLVSRYGVIAMGSSFDVVGPLARTVEDAALVLDVMAGRDPLDATTIERDAQTYELTDQKSNVKGLKVGVIKEYLAEGVDPEVKAAIEAQIDSLAAAGAKVSEVSLPSVGLGLACYYILVPAEISSNLARYDGVKYGHSAPAAKTLAETYDLSRNQGFGAEAKRRILTGTYVLSSGYYDAYYKQAQKVRTLLTREFKAAFERFDVLVAPNAPTVAFPLGQKAQDPLAMYLCDVMQVAVNLAGACALSLPIGLAHGLPVGLQLIGPQRGERTLLKAGAAVEGMVGRLEVAV
ncbi:Asp-tRNA(Asn)/Glu-tRNA(Gln) amidotransferase subunit GatA [Candidatus Parcubacteria bacterium]|nr:Asp-tRNA(Asn)/Glu-tRNA(Gln) amidotransferase subunit GatA [Candidatus Parcubacteria bacterium]